MLYAALWRALPGPTPVRAAIALALFAAVVAVCFLWLFPAVAPLLPFNDNPVQPTPTAPHTTGSARTLGTAAAYHGTHVHPGAA